MTNEEAIEFLECCAVTSCACASNKRNGGDCPGDDAVLEAVKIQVIKMAIEALKKQIPKKPDIEGDGYDGNGNMVYDFWLCPNCEGVFEIEDTYRHCPVCGQHIDWSDCDEEAD